MADAKQKYFNGTSYVDVFPKTTWTQVLNKPASFTPSDHTHLGEDITDGNFTNINTIEVANTSSGLASDLAYFKNNATGNDTGARIDFGFSTAADYYHAGIRALRTNEGGSHASRIDLLARPAVSGAGQSYLEPIIQGGYNGQSPFVNLNGDVEVNGFLDIYGGDSAQRAFRFFGPTDDSHSVQLRYTTTPGTPTYLFEATGDQNFKFKTDGNMVLEGLDIEMDGAITTGSTINSGSSIFENGSRVATRNYVDNAVISDTNNYVNSVSGSGNGTLTLGRLGLADLSTDLSHTHNEYLELSGGTMSGALGMGGNNISNVGNVTADKLVLGVDSELFLDGSVLKWRGGTSTYDVYHEGNKPTPADIGAATDSHTHNEYLQLSGGAMTGDLDMNNNDINSASYITTEFLSLSNDDSDRPVYVNATDQKLYFGIGEIYHSNNKPTASDVGADFSAGEGLTLNGTTFSLDEATSTSLGGVKTRLSGSTLYIRDDGVDA